MRIGGWPERVVVEGRWCFGCGKKWFSSAEARDFAFLNSGTRSMVVVRWEESICSACAKLDNPFTGEAKKPKKARVKA